MLWELEQRRDSPPPEHPASQRQGWVSCPLAWGAQPLSPSEWSKLYPASYLHMAAKMVFLSLCAVASYHGLDKVRSP